CARAPTETLVSTDSAAPPAVTPPAPTTDRLRVRPHTSARPAPLPAPPIATLLAAARTRPTIHPAAETCSNRATESNGSAAVSLPGASCFQSAQTTGTAALRSPQEQCSP